MVAIVDIGTLIVKTPQVAGGRPCIAGTRMTVQNIVMDSQADLSPQDIVTEYPYLSLAQVYAALAYYYANQEAMDREIASYKAECNALETKWMSGNFA
ncbi:DUF433 domain-containing protein [Nostoc parmelioides]|uniref:DUF433 domain-containing protein n=1 Tax=Nostoc parmelioides FACHB-3921 TaxID=2692909 RepID=A0ABR8BD47_9NOSO|nr:DUF433 domain-containing protein [Nostoc parmelioides]MBD2251781.1 DUF433 domain-containing protein [Nostoc parmelioides FACHB-3921]